VILGGQKSIRSVLDDIVDKIRDKPDTRGVLSELKVISIFQYNFNLISCYLRQGGNVFASYCLSVCLSVCEQDNSKSYGWIFLKF